MTNEDFCKHYSSFYGEKLDNIEQLTHILFTGEELKEYLEHFMMLQEPPKNLSIIELIQLLNYYQVIVDGTHGSGCMTETRFNAITMVEKLEKLINEIANRI